MSIRQLLLLCVPLTFLAGCEAEQLVERRTQAFEVTVVKPPKHFYVTLKNVDTGQVFSDVYVSKRCSRWKEVPVGAHLNLSVATYRSESGVTRMVLENRSNICPRS